MSKTIRNEPNSDGSTRRSKRHISVRAVRRNPADLRRFSRAVLSIAMAEAAAQADGEKEGAVGGVRHHSTAPGRARPSNATEPEAPDETGVSDD